MNQTAGYSGTPLAKKLGIKPNFSMYVINPPTTYWSLLDPIPEGIFEMENPQKESVDFVHLFCTTREELETHSGYCKSILKKTGLVWVSWPKGSSKIPTDLKRDPIREHLLGLGLVDTKVAAINEDWSGLKFVYRIKDR